MLILAIRETFFVNFLFNSGFWFSYCALQGFLTWYKVPTYLSQLLIADHRARHVIHSRENLNKHKNRIRCDKYVNINFMSFHPLHIFHLVFSLSYLFYNESHTIN